MAAVLLKIVWYRHSKVVWHYMNPPGLTLWQRIKDGVKIRVIGRYFVDRCIACGEEVYSGLVSAGMPEKKTALVYNVIDVSRFFPDSKRREHVRKSLGAPDGFLVFLLLGWDPLRKGLDIFIQAVEETVRNKKNKAIFVIVGKEETRKAVSSVLEETDLRKAIRVIDPVEDFSSLLSGVDVFVSCSRSEGSPYAVLEAMAARKVIISSNIPIPVVSGPNGRAEGVLVYPTEDWRSLSQLMGQSQEIGQSKREALGLANWEFVKKYYSIEIWAEKIIEIYGSRVRGV